jgi:stalled ribosome rescue protein Dom34
LVVVEDEEMSVAQHYHAAVWIDHHEAHVIHFSAYQADEETVHPAHPPRHLHHKAGSASGTHTTDEPEFYRDVAGALAEAHAILICGPSSAKTEFVKYLHKHAPGIFDGVSGIETMDRVTDNQLLAAARRYFAQADHMRPQKG